MDTYYDPHDLAGFAEVGEESPELRKAFSQWYGASLVHGVQMKNVASKLSL